MTTYNDQLSKYISDLFAPHDDVLEHVWQETPKSGLPSISVQPEEGRFLQILVKILGASRALEIGTLGGYSSIWIARGLVESGKLITIEKDPAHAKVAHDHFKTAGLLDIVEIHIGDGHKILKTINDETPFDFIFIDAEKLGYGDYFNWALKNIRLGGIIATHNAFRRGSVTNNRADDEYSQFMRDFNRRVASEESVISTIYPAGDGTLISVKVS